MASLFDEAQQKLGANDFVGAREAYRHAALHEMPEFMNLMRLNLSESEESLTFRQKLRTLYPQSLSIWLEEIGHLSRLGRFKEIITLCTEALQIFHRDMDERFMIRSHRLKAACQISRDQIAVDENTSLILEDIRAMWQEADVDSIFKERQEVLGIIFSVLGTRRLSILETLAQDEIFPPVVRQAFEAKITQLRAFEDALKAL
jgi:hypothetical protein